MTLFLMARNAAADILKLDEKHDVSFPNSVVELFSGVLGVPPAGLAKKLQKIILRGQAPLRAVKCKPRSGEMEEEQKSLEKNLGHAVRRDIC